MPSIWPDGMKCVVVLSFDIDGVSSAINRDPESKRFPSLMSLREYGPSIATPRILRLLDQHQIRASFFIPGYVAETHKDLVKHISNSGHEVGHHGYMHEPPATLSIEQEANVLDRGIEILQHITGKRPKGYRSPSWELSENSLYLLAEREFEYDSSLMGNDVPYLVQANGHTITEIPIHWELDDAPFFNYTPFLNQTNGTASPEHVYQVWATAFEGAHHYGRSFVLTMHPWIIGRPGRLLMLNRLILYIKSFGGVKFMTAHDLAQIWAERDIGHLQ